MKRMILYGIENLRFFVMGICRAGYYDKKYITSDWFNGKQVSKKIDEKIKGNLTKKVVKKYVQKDGNG